MSDIKLTYFNIKGRAELPRVILSYAGVKFTDERLTGNHTFHYQTVYNIFIPGEQFGALKPKLPYGQMPVLNYKGEVVCQSITIAR